jgi:hypothetical protein
MNEKQHDLIIAVPTPPSSPLFLHMRANGGVQDLDDEHLLVQGHMLEQIKKELDEKLEENTYVLDSEERNLNRP